ncbi:MAG: PD40 domain-containing protein [Victivallales bacterium]|nr:PD40 domain-containing protein [Victivallales bacterium]
MKNIFGIALLCAWTPAVFAAEASSSKVGVENLFNSRIGVTKTILLFEPQGQLRKATDRNIESIHWSADGANLIIDQQGINTFFAIASVKTDADKATTRVLSAARAPNNTRLNNSNPAWYTDGLSSASRSGKYFVFCGQNVNSNEFKRSLPGYGLHCNLVLGDANGRSFWQLTNETASFTAPKGVVMPRFSQNGKLLLWTMVTSQVGSEFLWGNRTLAIADFSFQGSTPSLKNIRQFAPDGLRKNGAFLESYGFSPDGRKILFAANLNNQEWVGMDICEQDLYDKDGNFSLSEKPRVLTRSPNTWDRYGAWSPNGHKIAWSSSEDYTISYLGPGGSRWQQNIVTELWIMNADGRDKVRLTGFNDRSSPQFIGVRCYVGMVAWHPDGKRIALVLHQQYKAYNMNSTVVILELGDKRPPVPDR